MAVVRVRSIQSSFQLSAVFTSPAKGTTIKVLPFTGAGQADAQVAAVAFEHAQAVADHVVQHLVAAAEDGVVHRRAVVLEVDPAGDDHGCGHDQLEHGEAVVLAPVVAVQEGPAGEVEATGARPRCG